MMFIPLTIYAQNDTKIENLIIKTEVQESPETRELLKQLVETQQKQDEKFNQLLHELNQKKFDVEIKEDPRWKEGDVLVASATIFAFFTFGPLVIQKYEASSKDKFLKINNNLIYLIVVGQTLQLYVMLSIVVGVFSVIIYGFIMTITLAILASIGMLIRDQIILTNRSKAQIANLESSFQQANVDFDIDFDRIREKRRSERESGE